METLLLILGNLSPLVVLTTIFGGLVFGVLYRNIPIERKTIYLFLIWVLPFILGRIIFFGAAATAGTASGAGVAVTILFILYVIVTLVTRRVSRRFFGSG